jgi:hypothetical protein
MPTEQQLVDAWVTLSQLKKEALEGLLIDYGFDTPTACGQAQLVVELALAELAGAGYRDRLWLALDERIAAAQT